ncbi:hypothetical protein HY249_02445 [Candidatus Azambacteria bacterium]|nr:hypothetical protein [Candidatus Azambacteria bacterium]
MKNNIKIFFLSATTFLLIFSFFLFINIFFSGVVFKNIPVYIIFLFVICFTAFLSSYLSYERFKISKELGMLFISFVSYSFGFTFALHAIAAPEVTQFGEAVFDVTEHYGPMLSPIIFSILVLPFRGSKEILYENAKKIFFIMTLAMSLVFVVLAYFSYIADFLEKNVNLIAVLPTGIFFLAAFYILFKKYIASNDQLTFYIILSLSVFANSSIIPFFYNEWNLVWWYFNAVFLIGFIILLFGLFKPERRQ